MAGELADEGGLQGPLLGERLEAAAGVVGKVEAGGDGASEERELAVGEESCTLPDASGDEGLQLLSVRDLLAESDGCCCAIGPELEHLDGVAEVEMEDFVGLESMHLGEGAGFEQVVDGRAERACAARESDGVLRGVGAAIVAALDGVRLDGESVNDFAGVHRMMVTGCWRGAGMGCVAIELRYADCDVLRTVVSRLSRGEALF